MQRAIRLAGLLAGALLATAAQAADMPVKAGAPVPYTQAPWLELYTGLSVAPHSVYGYAGGDYAFNNNLNQDGWLLRISGGDGNYDYYRAVGLKQNVDFQTGDVSVGYQTFVGNVRISGYLGVNVENDSNSDPLAKIKGTEWGVKGQGEIYAPINGFGYVYLLGNVSSAWNSYLTLGQLGYNLTNAISVGPEAMALGNDRFDAVRLGPFASVSITPYVQLIVSGGFSWDTRRNSLNDNSGGYGSLHLRALF